MALLNDFFDSSEYIFSMDCRDSLLPVASDNITNMWNFEEQTFPFFGLKYEAESLLVPPRLGENAEPPLMPGFSEFCGISGFQDQCNHFVPDFSPAYNSFQPVHSQSNSSSACMEEPSMKIRRYSEEERKDRIIRYLNKRNRRNFNKTIKYACRKTLADRRIRVRGRFARNIDLSHEYKETRDNKHSQSEEEYCDENAEIKHNGEDWLQEAVASLMYLPIFAGQ